MNVAGHYKKLKEYLVTLVLNKAPTVIIKRQKENWFYQHLQHQGWVSVQEADLPTVTIFSKIVLLIPVDECSFKTCYFPQHLVEESELNEAIELDIKQWSLWDEYDFFYTHQSIDEQWKVSVWLWSQQAASKYPAQNAKMVTHIIPEPAWYAACLAGNQFSLLISPNEHYASYALVSSEGWVEKIAQVQSQQQAQRYWHSWGLVPIEHCWITEKEQGEWCPEKFSAQTIDKTAVPHSQLLKKTRLASAQDWTAPTSYSTFFGVIMLAWSIWMVADAGLLYYHQEQVEQQLMTVRQSANDVLQIRQQVTSRRKLYSQVQILRYQQQLPEHLIAQLTQQIPEDIWLNRLQIEDDQLDINGRGLQVARLLPLLEKIEGIEQVMLLSAITPNVKTGEETFQIRLVLSLKP